MFNQTLIINATMAFAESSWVYIKEDFLNRCLDIIYAPFSNYDMLWMLLPLLATTIFLEFYFGRYKQEELGWNTAYGNGIVLLFVAIDLFRRSYEPLGLGIREAILLKDTKMIISLVIIGLALLIMFIDFFHFLPKKLAYLISSPTYLNFTALLGIIIVYSENIPLDGRTLGACIVMLALFTLVAHIIYLMVPSYTPPHKRIMEQDGKEEKEEAKKEKKGKKEKKKGKKNPGDEEGPEEEEEDDEEPEDEKEEPEKEGKKEKKGKE